ncbi:MAG: hypothetical protein OEY10_08535 [Nitrosopumilus sp.]|nr:hypothetical protein [Nitrosopumilus sp.]
MGRGISPAGDGGASACGRPIRAAVWLGRSPQLERGSDVGGVPTAANGEPERPASAR